jgi:hypothetical protein
VEILPAQRIRYRLFIFAGMWKIQTITGILIISFLGSCSEDIQLTGTGDPIPIIYSILDSSDSIHYVRLGKSFSGEAAVRDLLNEENMYYADPTITLVQVNSQEQYSFGLVKDIFKEPGYFPIGINSIYQLKQELNPGEYILTIKPDENSTPIEQRVILFEDFNIVTPGKVTKRIYFYDDPVSFVWTSSSYSSQYELAITLEYDEADQNSEVKKKAITYSRNILLDELEWQQGRWKYRLYSDPFFGKIGQKIAASELVSYRKPTRLMIRVSAPNKELSQFIQQNSPDTQVETNYTGNLIDAIGIVASKYTIQLQDLQLSPKAMDSLKSGRFTKDLGFISNPDW